MKLFLVTAAAAALALAASAGQQKPAPDKSKDPRLPEGYTIPAEDAQRANPVKPAESSLAAGAKFYSSQCAMCHGKNGDGKGDLAQQMDDLQKTMKSVQEDRIKKNDPQTAVPAFEFQMSMSASSARWARDGL